MSNRSLRDFVVEMTRLTEKLDVTEAALLTRAKPLMSDLIRRDIWLPSAFAEPSDERYRQYLLYCDPLERFSVVSFVWGPGQATPIHDHTTWGIIGVMRGAEFSQRYEKQDGLWRPIGEGELMEPGGIDCVSPDIGDVHKVMNPQKTGPSVSIHMYGGNIGRINRHAFDQATGEEKSFVSGYSSTVLPNIWD
jgi:predicted metal-dependent enzyme (double-stranded beta helix superfamily)